MIIRTFEPDYAYMPDFMSYDAIEYIGIAAELRGQQVGVIVHDSPCIVASALEALAAAIRRTWLL